MISIIIPVYNEENCLPALLERLEQLLSSTDLQFEVVFVDDHSTDKTEDKLREICDGNSGPYRMLRLSRNSGSHIAIIAGLAACQGQAAVYMAGDLQDPPELIAKMVEKWRSGTHIVWATREKREGVSVFDALCSKIFYWAAEKLYLVKLPPSGADFALIDRKVINSVLQSTRGNVSLGALIAWTGFQSTTVPYVKQPRAGGQSGWTWRRKITTFIDAIVGYSYVPMRVMSAIGTLIAMTGGLYAFILIVRYLFFDIRAIQGWASLMVVVLLLGGVQMAILGVLGEYLWRSFEAARNRPLYFIEEKRGFNES